MHPVRPGRVRHVDPVVDDEGNARPGEPRLERQGLLEESPAAEVWVAELDERHAARDRRRNDLEKAREGRRWSVTR